MERIFLFLYPCRPYLEAVYDEWRGEHARIPRDMAVFQTVVDRAYRQADWRIAWLCHSQPEDPREIDCGILAEEFGFRREDLFVPAGAPSATGKNFHFADTKFSLGFLPPSEVIAELRIGGFHQWCCVDRFASEAYAAMPGKLVVDEGLTDRFFALAHLYDQGLMGSWNPYQKRDRPSLQLFGYHEVPRCDLLGVLEDRKEKPWFVQA